jgi:integrase
MARQGQLVRRGDRTWLVRAFVGRDGGGKRRYANRTVHGAKKDAERTLTALLQARNTNGLSLEPARQTLGAWLDEWLDLVKPRIGVRTAYDYGRTLARDVRPALGGIRLAKLSTADVQRFINDLTARGMKPNTVRLAIAPLRAALREAVRLGRLVKSPCDHVTMPRLERAERRVLGPSEAQQLLAVCEDDDAWGPLIITLLMTGVRPGELCALRWADLDGSTLRVQRALSYTADGWVVCDTKTSGSRRAIVLGDLEQRALARQRKRQAAQRLQAGTDWQDNDLMFATATGRAQDARNVSRRVLPRLLKRAKLPPMRLYDLRHSSATLLLAAGINPKVVSERLGHSTTRLTLDTYSHVLPSMQQEAADVLGRLVTAKRTGRG